jgi:hypothetical protein
LERILGLGVAARLGVDLEVFFVPGTATASSFDEADRFA